MGRILRAFDARLKRIVALKKLRAKGEGAIEERFRTEALLTARLQHPSIVPIYDVGQWPTGESFYSMRLVPGRSLNDAIGETTTLGQRLALLPHVLAVAEAVAYAHSQRIIHRDLKPANVLVGEFGETVVIDWGLAKDLSKEEAEPPQEGSAPSLKEGLTMAGAVIGTAGYMPPEQAKGQPVDERADVYALGSVLYRLLAGAPPYSGSSPQQVLQESLAGPPTPLSQKQKGLPQDLLALVSKAMARDPRDRYPTARELAEDLRRFQTGQIIGAYPYTRWELVRRFVRRYRAVLTVTAVALLVLTGLGMVSIRRILAEQERAERGELAALNRADTLSLLRTRAAVEQDPNSVAALRKLSPGFARWPEVRLIAADAKARGLATFLRGHTGAISALRITHDGQTLVTSSDDRSLRVWDLEHGQSRVLAGHTGEIRGLALSADSRHIASASQDGTLRLWDLATGQNRVLLSQSLPVTAAAFLPDGRSLISAGEDGALRLWDLTTGKARRVLRIEGAIHERLATSPDQKWVALTSSHEPVVRLWNSETEELRVLAGHQERVSCVVFSPGGELLATGGVDRSVRLWDLKTGQGRLLGEHRGPITALAFSPDGRTVVAGSSDPVLQAWDVATGQHHELAGHQGRVEALAFSPDGKLLASGGYDRRVLLWELSTGQSQSLGGAEDTLLEFAFSPDGRRLISGSADGLLRVYPITESLRVLKAPNSFIYSGLVFSSDGRRLAVGTREGTVRWWELTTGSVRVLGGHQGRTVVAISSDDRWLATGGEEGTVRLWDSDGRLLRVLEGQSSHITGLAFSPDGHVLASSSLTGEVRLWDRDSGQVRMLRGEAQELVAPFGLTFSPDGSHLAVALELGHAVQLWKLSTGELILLPHPEGQPQSLTFSPDGSTLLSGATDHALRLWDLTGTLLRRIDLGSAGVRQVLFAPDGRTILMAEAHANSVRRWDAKTGQALASLNEHSGEVNTIALSADGKRLVSASDDWTVRLWDLESGKSRVLRGHQGPVEEARFSPDGRQILSLSADGTIRIWPDDLPSSPEALRAWLQAVDAPVHEEE